MCNICQYQRNICLPGSWIDGVDIFHTQQKGHYIGYMDSPSPHYRALNISFCLSLSLSCSVRGAESLHSLSVENVCWDKLSCSASLDLYFHLEKQALARKARLLLEKSCSRRPWELCEVWSETIPCAFVVEITLQLECDGLFKFRGTTDPLC